MKRGTSAQSSVRAVQSGSPRSGTGAQPAKVRGASGDPARGSYCTPAYVAQALGPIDLDPFSNPRSHIASALACWLERGDDGFGSGKPGTFSIVAPTQAQAVSAHVELLDSASDRESEPRALLRATHATRVWLQPDYVRDFTLRAVRHYLHTRFVALLRFDPRPEWADLIGGASEWIGVLSNSPGERSFEFDAPPGPDGKPLDGAGNTFPHALYARSYEDVTPAMRALCSYPDGTARHWRKRSALSGERARDWISQWGLDAALFTTTTTTNPSTT